MLSEEQGYLWLALNINVSVKRRLEMLEGFGSPLAIIKAGTDGLIKMGCDKRSAAELFGCEPERMAAEALEKMNKTNTHFIACNSTDYPSRLLKIPDYPIGLFVRGNLIRMENRRVLGVVGSRTCSSYGAEFTYKASKKMAEAGAVIVSGMADGIDSKAHIGALEGKGYTIAVLGCGTDICYPAANIHLMERIIETGCVISELPCGTKAGRFTFPARNRIISGLSDVVAVMEAAERSGSLITADRAQKQGRHLMALPGNVTSSMSKGTNRLIKQGAEIITSVEDIAKALGLEAKNKKNNEKTNISLATEEKLVYDCIHSEPITVDELVLKTNMSVRSVQYALTMLELQGLTAKISGQKYIRRD